MGTQAVELSISLQDVDLQQFDVLEVWRSRDTANGPYEALTSAGSTGARFPADSPAPPAVPITGPRVNAAGKQLILLVDDTTLTITISGSDPRNYNLLAADIADQSLGLLRSYAVNSLLVIETVEVGGHASLTVIGGDVAGLIGYELNSPAFGREAYIPLVAGTTQYTFTDQQGSPSYFYKIRLRNSLRDLVSEFSAPLSPLTTPTVTNTAIGYVDLTDMDGAALEAREVRLYSRFNGQLSNGRVVAGFSKNALTDANGHVEFVLVRGLAISVAIAGTDLVRDLIVPTDASIARFNLLDPMLGMNDVFKVQVPNIPYATRRSF